MATARGRAPATPETVAPEREAATPEGFLPLGGISVTVGEGGTSARAEPSLEADTLATLPEGARRETDGLVFGEFTWLRTPWEGPEADDAWIPGEETDFPRSAAYNEVSGAWYESAAVVAFRRSLVRDLLRVRGANRERLAEVDTLSGEALEDLEVSLTRETIRRYTTISGRCSFTGPAGSARLSAGADLTARRESRRSVPGFGPTLRPRQLDGRVRANAPCIPVSITWCPKARRRSRSPMG